MINVVYPEDEGTREISTKGSLTLSTFSEMNEEASFLPQHVARKLQPSENIKTSSCFKNMMSFKNGMTDLNLY